MLHDFTEDPRLLAAALAKAQDNAAPLIHEPEVDPHHPVGDGLALAITELIRGELKGEAQFASLESDRNHMIVDIAAVARAPHGDVFADVSQCIDVHLGPEGLEQIRDSGMRYRSGLQLPPAQYTVRFVVRDALGNRMGSVAAPVTVAQ